MKTYLGPGDELEFTGTAKNSGDPILLGSVVGLVVETVASTDKGVAKIRGKFLVPMKNTDTPTQGTKLYWDNTNNYFTTTATSNTFAGWYASPTQKVSGATTGEIALIGGKMDT